MPAAGGDTEPPAALGRRCRVPRHRAGGLRPTDVIGAFFLAGLAMSFAGALVAAVNAIEPWAWGRWLALHLLFVGGISQFILGASQFFAGAFLATDPPARKLIRFQLIGWNLGVAAVAVGVPIANRAITYVGVGCLVTVLAAYAAGLLGLRKRSLNRAPWATRWYLAAASFLAFGVAAGAMLALSISWPYGNLLGAHMALNLGGWFGASIVGTLHTFFPSLTRSRLRLPRLQGPTFSAWVAGITSLALGYGISLPGVATAGWILLAIAAGLLTSNILGCWLAGSGQLSLAARLVGVAQLFLVLGLLVAATSAVMTGPAEAIAGSTRATVATLLVGGWIGLTVAGSLLHLLSLLLRVRDLRRAMPVARPRRDAAFVALTALGVSGAALGEYAAVGPLLHLAMAMVVLAYGTLAGRLAVLLGRILIHARPSV